MLYSLLILILIFFILWPLLKVGWNIWTQVRRVRRFMADPEGEMRRSAQQQRSAAPEPPARKKKKIDPDVGEYVEYTEIEVSAEERAAGNAGRTQASFKKEEQITDIKWVDIN